jgi:nitrate/TMAO reductase-like tetraheme cytochrome c subunit
MVLGGLVMRVGFWVLALLMGLAGGTGPVAAADYLRDVWSSAHTERGMATSTNADCLGCHREVLADKPRAQSQSGINAGSVTAWYQTLDTYKGAQDSFHRRHMATPYASQVMDLKCNTCHLGHDPREEASVPMVPPRDRPLAATARKQVNPERTCLMCHGKFPFENMGLPGDWSEIRADMENPDAPNGCLSCHAETFRTVRHRVNYLKAASIEDAAKTSSDVCYGCHGGRAWYRTSFAYPRHAWPNMPDDAPDWASGRPTESESRFLTGLRQKK